MGSDVFFDRLFECSRKVTPYLEGKISAVPTNASHQCILHIDHPCSDNIHDLYSRLQVAHPEAGSAYWLTRTWDLVCWQPVYLAFISIYQLGGLPNLTRIAQYVQPKFVSGFQFESEQYVRGTETELIRIAGLQLQTLSTFFRQEMSHWTRIRPGFTNHLLADSLLGCLVKVSQWTSSFSDDDLLQQAEHWLEACSLPVKLANRLSIDEQSDQLVLVRTSCCLVYKCYGRDLCANCPRQTGK
ncbi:siderophore ferric iron reductase [Vibrio tetraodonis]|uniref:siderophore ferric iron reductase n=1 Tax=Vibrio tetraodonis TaxID=2231647 RepID=UPI000E0A577D|nr:siderophore ferric iron reductase [Vibrio tetraodonis]